MCPSFEPPDLSFENFSEYIFESRKKSKNICMIDFIMKYGLQPYYLDDLIDKNGSLRSYWLDRMVDAKPSEQDGIGRFLIFLCTVSPEFPVNDDIMMEFWNSGMEECYAMSRFIGIGGDADEHSAYDIIRDTDSVYKTVFRAYSEDTVSNIFAKYESVKRFFSSNFCVNGKNELVLVRTQDNPYKRYTESAGSDTNPDIDESINFTEIIAEYRKTSDPMERFAITAVIMSALNEFDELDNCASLIRTVNELPSEDRLIGEVYSFVLPVYLDSIGSDDYEDSAKSIGIIKEFVRKHMADLALLKNSTVPVITGGNPNPALFEMMITNGKIDDDGKQRMIRFMMMDPELFISMHYGLGDVFCSGDEWNADGCLRNGISQINRILNKESSEPSFHLTKTEYLNRGDYSGDVSLPYISDIVDGYDSDRRTPASTEDYCLGLMMSDPYDARDSEENVSEFYTIDYMPEYGDEDDPEETHIIPDLTYHSKKSDRFSNNDEKRLSKLKRSGIGDRYRDEFTKACNGDADSQFRLGIICAVLDEPWAGRNDAFTWFRLSAVKGVAEAQYNTAISCFYGSGTSKSSSEGLEWLEAAAASCNYEALEQISYMYRSDAEPVDGIIAESDDARAAEWCWISSRNNPDSAFNLGLYHQSQSGKESLNSAAACYLHSYKKGDIDALNNLASILMDREGTMYCPSLAEDYLMTALEERSADAAHSLGVMYHLGMIPHKDENDAESMFRLAAEMHNPRSEYNMAVISELSGDFTQALQWYRYAVKHKVPDASWNLAVHYLNGENVSKDIGMATYHFHEALMNGLPDAFYQYCRLAYGDDSLHDEYSRTLSFMVSKSRRDVTYAGHLALCLIDGEFVPRDDEMADELAARVCQSDDAYMNYNIGIAYYDKNNVKALNHLKRSVSLGYDPAKTVLGDIFREGTLTEISLDEAMKMYSESETETESLIGIAKVYADPSYHSRDLSKTKEYCIKYIDAGGIISLSEMKSMHMNLQDIIQLKKRIKIRKIASDDLEATDTGPSLSDTFKIGSKLPTGFNINLGVFSNAAI